MSIGPYLQDTQKRKVIFFTGKGGVGKTSLAWATALCCHRLGMKVSVASWNPLGEQGQPPPERHPEIPWTGLETLQCFREYTLQVIRFEKIYDTVFDNRILRTFVLATPGLADTVVAGKIWDLAEKGPQDLLIVDLPSTGHAISFFRSPLGVRRVFSVGFVHRETEKICDLLKDPSVRIDLVSLPEELPLTEAKQLQQTLQPLHPFHFGFLHMNGCLPDFGSDPLPETVDGPFLDFFERYLSQRNQQALVLADARDCGLALVETPRILLESTQEGIQAMADHLEKA